MPDPSKQARGQDQETVNCMPEWNVQTMSINGISSYTLSSAVNRTPLSFLLDTGAEICLIKTEVW